MSEPIAPRVAHLSSVTHRYGDTVAVDSIELAVPEGLMVGFVGPDGVGKSTALALISGVRKVQSGTVEVLGGDIADLRHRTAVCGQIAYMPQGLGRNLYPTLSVIENVDFFGRLFGQSAAEREWRIEDLLASTGLTPFGDRPAGKLSGGMKQKLGLCCSLMHEPELLILDEPTTGVDPLSRRQFWELIARMRVRRPRLSVLVATAYMDEAEGFDWIVAMDAGKVLASGTPDELKSAAGAKNLEQAFIALLPEEKRRGHRTLAIPPRNAEGAEVAIEARGLTRRFGAFTAVDHITVRIERGEIFGFLGSNGCGKTTTMKMLTGLLPVTEGEALLFGHHVNPNDLDTRRRVGFMSQAFSLYTELTVRQNLELHGHLFHLEPDLVAKRITELVKRFGLEQYMEDLPESLPLGVRQRLSLAVAVIHSPEMLILDEPTSGVDPVARDSFWELLVELSREQGVTIFISTHFMNEAERCDRISLMHAGRILAQGTPAELVRSRNAESLEQAFIVYLEEAAGIKAETAASETAPETAPAHAEAARAHRASIFSIGRLWAYASREAMEIRRDPVRLAFAIFAPILLMVVMGYGISFDVENLRFAVLDQDNSPESRRYLENFRYSRYFTELAPIRDHATMERRLDSGELNLAIEVPPEFGKDLRRGRQPEVGVWVDGAMPFRAETARDYVERVQILYLGDLYDRSTAESPPQPPTDIEARYLYNQDFESVFAIVPGAIMLLLVLIPSMLTALGVVREKELGSITNLYATPVTRLEFVLGKQFPYVLISFVNFITLVLLTVFLFGVPVKGSMLTLSIGSALYVTVTTGLGLFISSFVSSQIAAIFATAIITTLPAINFSGMLVPVSSLSGGARLMGETFPSAYFQQISIGTITKAMGFQELRGDFLALAIFFFIYLFLSLAFLPKQES